MPRWRSLGALIALGLTLSACASSKATGFPDPADVPTGAGIPTCADPVEGIAEYEGEIFVLDSCFRPGEVVVAVGTEVHWVQEGAAPHNVVFVDLPINSHPDCSFENVGGCMAKGDDFKASFNEAGEFDYYCVLHGTPDGTGMAGSLTVE